LYCSAVAVHIDADFILSFQEYIRALCNPQAWFEFSYGPELHAAIAGSDSFDGSLASIEKQTKAALLSGNPGYILIQGDELTIALADSLLCELVKENSVVGHQSSSHDSSRLDNMLQDKFSNGDLESTTDSDVTNYSEEIKRALLLSLLAADTKNSESTINLDEHDDLVTEVVDTGTDSSDHDEDMNTFVALARSKNYSDAEAKAVISQKGYKISDKEFVRALSTNRRIIGRTVKHESTETKVTGGNSSSGLADCHILQRTLSGSTSDDNNSIIDLRSDAEDDEFDDLIAGSLQTGATASVSDELSGAQSKKSQKKKKKKKSMQVVRDPGETKSSDCGMDIDFISLIPMASSNKKVTMKDLPTAMPQDSLTLGELTSAVMQPVKSRKEKRRMAAASVYNVDRSRSPLKPCAKESPMSSIPHLPLPRFPFHSQKEFQVGNSSAVSELQPGFNSTGVKFGAGPKLRYIVIDGSNIAMQ